MIAGNLEDLQKILGEDVFTKIQDAINRFQTLDFSYNEWTIVDDSMKYIYLNSSGADNNIMEYHEVFTDIHITVDGMDMVYLSEKTDAVMDAYNADKDYGLVSVTDPIQIMNPSGNFVLLKPKEIHTNILSKGSSKIVIKLKHHA